MNILAFDTSFDACSVALMCDGKESLFDSEAGGQGHAEHLVPKVQSILTQAGLGFQDLEGIAVGTGPGSFTGIRVAVAAARGFGIASSLPVIGVNSFEIYQALARLQNNPAKLLYIVLDARRRDLFYKVYDGSVESEPRQAMPEELIERITAEDGVVVGTGLKRLKALAAPKSFQSLEVSPQDFLTHLVDKAKVKLSSGQPLPLCQPYYLIPPGITVPQTAQRSS